MSYDRTHSGLHHRIRSLTRGGAAGAAALAMLALAQPVPAVDWLADEADWHDADNWSTQTLPTSTIEAQILNGGTAIVSTGDAQSHRLRVGRGTAVTHVGTLKIVAGGILAANHNVDIGSGRGTGTLIVENGGQLSTTNNLFVGSATSSITGGSGLVYLSGAGSSITFNYGIIGDNGAPGIVNQTGGTLTTSYASVTPLSALTIGQSGTLGDGVGVYNLSGGTLNLATDLVVGRANRLSSSETGGDAFGTFNQTGGDVMVGTSQIKTLRIGATHYSSPTTLGANRGGEATGVYNLHAGSLTVRGGILMGDHENQTPGRTGYGGSGTFAFGNADGTGTLQQLGGREGAARDVTVRAHKAYDATFIGHGDVQFTGTLTNHGQVVADGHGTDRTLDMSHFTTVARTFTEADLTSQTGAVGGWYARNQGKLLLPTITVGSGNSTATWGDDVLQADLGLVNSVRVSFNNATAGDLDIALLASDHGDVATAPAAVAFIGAWDLQASNGLNFDGASLTIRYDAAAATAAGLSEADLQLYHFTGGQWVDVTDSLDMANGLITSGSVGSFSQFAVGAAIPEPASLGLLGSGVLVLVLRRRRA